VARIDSPAKSNSQRKTQFHLLMHDMNSYKEIILNPRHLENTDNVKRRFKRIRLDNRNKKKSSSLDHSNDLKERINNLDESKRGKHMYVLIVV